MVAEETASPGALSTGIDSPVRAASLTADEPSRTMPSTGILSPGRTTKISPRRTCSMGTVTSVSSASPAASAGFLRITVAVFGASFMRDFNASVVRPLDMASSILPTVIRVRIMAADSK